MSPVNKRTFVICLALMTVVILGLAAVLTSALLSPQTFSLQRTTKPATKGGFDWSKVDLGSGGGFDSTDAASQSDLDDLSSKVDDLFTQVEDLSSSLDDLSSSVDDVSNNVDDATSRVDEACTQLSSVPDGYGC